ncbi:MAG: COX15/CtaA family protein [Saprospiraceae bacterium]|nr:COX15/CtaA family protein [Saprospiraceae bacterium]
MKTDAPFSGVERRKKYPLSVKLWLIIGLFMIFVQVVVGGITRLTGSGLSITRWEIVTGTLPPLDQEQWEEAFDLYKQTPQYQKINEGMSMADFKFIYFWEYVHRLWARMMGLVFVIPLAFFWWKGMLDRKLLRRLGIVFLLAALAASFGWIMVASGLVDRPWVNAYKLTVHLSIAFVLFGYLFWTVMYCFKPSPKVIHNKLLKRWGLALLALLALQIVLGGIMSGMKAALFYPTWPDMNGKVVPAIIFQAEQWNVHNFVNYDDTPFMAALVQSAHRFTAYVLIIIGLWFSYRILKASLGKAMNAGALLLISMLIIQILLGILTLVNSVGEIPVDLGVMHQGGALLLLGIVLFLNYHLQPSDNQ